MNDTDPYRFCTTCQCSKPRSTFHQIRTGKPGRPRWACADCYDSITKANEQIKRANETLPTLP